VPEALAVCPKPSERLALQWLAIALTPRLGPTRARRLVEHFRGVQNIFKASLTGLEATGIQTVSAQSLGTGQSIELAQDELGRVAAARVTVVCRDAFHLPRTVEADLRSAAGPLCSAEMWMRSRSRGSQSWARAIPHLTGWAWPRGWHAISRTAAW